MEASIKEDAQDGAEIAVGGQAAIEIEAEEQVAAVGMGLHVANGERALLRDERDGFDAIPFRQLAQFSVAEAPAGPAAEGDMQHLIRRVVAKAIEAMEARAGAEKNAAGCECGADISGAVE